VLLPVVENGRYDNVTNKIFADCGSWIVTDRRHQRLHEHCTKINEKIAVWVNEEPGQFSFVDDAEQAVSLINDQTIATFCLDEAKKLTDNIQVFFG